MSIKVKSHIGWVEKIAKMMTGYESVPNLEKGRMIIRIGKAVEKEIASMRLCGICHHFNQYYGDCQVDGMCKFTFNTCKHWKLFEVDK